MAINLLTSCCNIAIALIDLAQVVLSAMACLHQFRKFRAGGAQLFSEFATS